MLVYTALFYIFSFLLTVSAIGVVTFTNPVYSVLMLISSFFNAAGIFLLLGAEFLAMAIVIVYVGAVAVLFLFVVMTINIKPQAIKGHLAKHYKSLILVSLVFLAELLAGIYLSISQNLHISEPATLLAFDGARTNTHQIGLVLYTKYAYLFHLCGIILFVAIVSAITLTHRESRQLKKQSVNKQLESTKENSIKLVSVQRGAGVGKHE